jgi:hypothetical protein
MRAIQQQFDHWNARRSISADAFRKDLSHIVVGGTPGTTVVRVGKTGIGRKKKGSLNLNFIRYRKNHFYTKGLIMRANSTRQQSV